MTLKIIPFHEEILPQAGVLLVGDPELVHAWFSLSFGIEQVHALADLETLDV